MFLLDTCTCIEFMRGSLDTGLEFMRAHDAQLFKLPAIVAAELHYGAEHAPNPEKTRRALDAFMLPFEIIPIDARCAREYGKIRHHLQKGGTIIGPNDLLIAATAKAHDAVLVTGNVEEFMRVPGLRLESWHEISL